MIDLGLSNSELAELLRLLKTSHALRIRVEMMDLDHRSLGVISNRFLSGSVDIDAEAEITRSLKLQLLDADRGLNLDHGNPNVGGMYLDRMIQVHYGVGRLDGTRWYDIPVFTGPVTKVDRDGVVVNVECQGKESMSSYNPWKARTFGKNLLRSYVIRAILGTLTGERFFKFEDTKSRTGGQTALKQDSNPFIVARKLAGGGGMHLFYDGLGRARLRRKPSRSVYVFDGSNIMSTPQVGYTITGVVNAVEVSGSKKVSSKNQKGKKVTKDKKFSVRVVADPSHPLSPRSLARGGVPRYMPKFIEDSNIKNRAEANQIARRELASALKESIDASFEAFPNPLLEEGDPYTINLPAYAGSATVSKITLPLQPGSGMSVGYNRRVTPTRLARRTRRR